MLSVTSSAVEVEPKPLGPGVPLMYEAADPMILPFFHLLPNQERICGQQDLLKKIHEIDGRRQFFYVLL